MRQESFFAPIHRLLETPEFRYAALNLALGYFESWEQYHAGQYSRNKSQEFFILGVKAVFPNVERQVADRGDDLAMELGLLHEQARCGAAHDGMPRAKVLLHSGGPAPISFVAYRQTLELTTVVIKFRRW